MSNPREVFLNARFLGEPVTGLQRWGREILGELDAMFDEGEIDPEQWKLVLLAPLGELKIQKYQHLQLQQGGFFRSHLWEQLSLSTLANGLLVCMKTTGPAFRRQPTVAMIHDALVWEQPESYSRLFRTMYRFVVPRLAKNSKALMTLSQDSAKQLSRHLGCEADQFKVIYCGHEHALRAAADNSILEHMEVSKHGYLLAVSSLMRNKNFAGAAAGVREAGLSRVPLVIVGGANPGVFRQEGVLPEDARHAGRVSDGELRALYENALALVYPSFHEGFGLPPLEAMALGCPVVTSRRSSLPEVCGDAVLYCDPASPKSIAGQLRQLYDSPGLRDELRIKGRAQAANFKWRDCARKWWDVVSTAANHD